jgi:hypothetical protein
MEQKDLQLLADIHNALLGVSTSGESTIIMGQCLISLKNFIETNMKKLNEK